MAFVITFLRSEGVRTGFSQQTASVISRLEDVDDEGHSMAMIRRVAAAVVKRVEVRFVSAE